MAKSKKQLINLQNFELDLFQPTAKTKGVNEFSIEGLITIDQKIKLQQYRKLLRFTTG